METGFQEIFHRYYRPVYVFFAKRGFCDADCEDLTQETFVRVYKSMDSLRQDDALSHWVLRIAANQWKNELRSRSAAKRDGVEVELLEADRPESAPGDPALPRPARQDPEDEAMSRQEVARVEAALGRLPPRMRRSILLRAQGWKYREIAEIMQLSIETVKSSIYQARRRLFDELAGGASRGAP